jgi:hypothetical protein
LSSTGVAAEVAVIGVVCTKKKARTLSGPG